MTSRHLWGRLLRGVVVAAGVLLICALAFVQVQQRLLRWRAERLLADIRAIQMGRSSWADAQRLMRKWGAWGMWDGSCTSEGCVYQVLLQDGSRGLATYFWTGKRGIVRSQGHEYKGWQLLLYWVLGGREADVYGGFRVKGGMIWEKSYEVLTPRGIFDRSVDDLIGAADSTTRFTPVRWPSLTKHPEYSVTAAGPCEGCQGSCSGCVLIHAEFTPFLDPGIEAQFLDFNLGCISSWRLCEEPKEIMPAAWRVFRKDGAEELDVDWPSCRVPVEAVARDYRYGLLTRVDEVKTVPERDGYIRYEARLHPLADLKGEALKVQDVLDHKLERVRLGWSDTVLAGGVKASDVKSGDQLILMFPELPASDMVGFAASVCGYIPDTAENRAAVQRGIARDALADSQ